MAIASAFGNVAMTYVASALERRLSRSSRIILGIAWFIAIVGICVAVTYNKLAIGIVIVLVSSCVPLLLAEKQLATSPEPHIVAGGIELQYWESEKVWVFSVNCTVTPVEGHGVLLESSLCHAEVFLPRGDTRPRLMISLPNLRKNDGPPMPMARVDEAAGIHLACRHIQEPWSAPLPTKLIIRVALYDGQRKTMYTFNTLLICPDPNKAYWIGQGEATTTEIAEFIE